MLKILICDDDYRSIQYLQNKIEQKLDISYLVESCTSGEELLAYIQDEKNKTDVLLMDIKLEKENGIEIAAVIKQSQPNLKVIL